MQGVNIICLGRLKESYLRDACKEYEKRLGGSCVLKIYELEPVALPNEPADRQIAAASENEAAMIEKQLAKNALSVAMCIEGKHLSSEELAAKLSDTAVQGKSAVNFIIGSSFGLAPKIKAMADIKLSMSKMTFPHQLMQMILLEQIYRGYRILNHEPYHK